MKLCDEVLNLLNEGIIVDTREYENTHGKLPGKVRPGFGLWLFKIGKKDFEVSANYGPALKQAKKEAKKLGVTEITVMP